MKPDLGYCPSEDDKSNIFCCLIRLRSRSPSYGMDHGRRTRTLADIYYPTMKAKETKSKLLFHQGWEDNAKPPQASCTSRTVRKSGLWSWNKETLSMWKNTVTDSNPLMNFWKLLPNTNIKSRPNNLLTPFIAPPGSDPNTVCTIMECSALKVNRAISPICDSATGPKSEIRTFKSTVRAPNQL